MIGVISMSSLKYQHRCCSHFRVFPPMSALCGSCQFNLHESRTLLVPRSWPNFAVVRNAIITLFVLMICAVQRCAVIAGAAVYSDDAAGSACITTVIERGQGEWVRELELRLLRWQLLLLYALPVLALRFCLRWCLAWHQLRLLSCPAAALCPLLSLRCLCRVRCPRPQSSDVMYSNFAKHVQHICCTCFGESELRSR